MILKGRRERERGREGGQLGENGLSLFLKTFQLYFSGLTSLYTPKETTELKFSLTRPSLSSTARPPMAPSLAPFPTP